MRGSLLYRLLALVALLCLAGVALAQNDGGDDDKASETKPTPSRTTPSATKARPTGTATTKEQGELPSDEPTPTDDSDNVQPDASFDSSYEETGMPGSVELTTPDYMAVPTPMFEIGDKITLGWKYTNDTMRPPSKLSICGRFPLNSGPGRNPRKLCDWDIAVNISGGSTKYVWDTVTQGAKGAAFVAQAGYLMYFYDADYGVDNPRPGAGRIVPSQFWFAMYNSRYDQTNQGVPVGYNPSAAHAVTVRIGSAAVLALLAIAGAAL